MLRVFTRQQQWIDQRQLFLMEDLLREYNDGVLCGTSLMLNSGACLLQDLHRVEGSFPVPLKRILPQRFTTPSLVQTLRKIDQLPRSAEVSVLESNDPRTWEITPGLKEIREKTLPQMQFDHCSIFRGTYGRVNPLFQHPEDAVLIVWKLGDYDQVYFMFVTQLYPHHEYFCIQDWGMVVYSHEMTGAIKRRVIEPPTTAGNPPDEPPDERTG